MCLCTCSRTHDYAQAEELVSLRNELETSTAEQRRLEGELNAVRSAAHPETAAPSDEAEQLAELMARAETLAAEKEQWEARSRELEKTAADLGAAVSTGTAYLWPT